MKEIVLSPVTRLSGILSVTMYLDTAGCVQEADCAGDEFRGYELMLRGRKISDAVYFTERICGICSTAHGFTAARLVEGIYGLRPIPEMILLQQAMLGAEFLQNHIRQLYLLALPDYLDIEPMSGRPVEGGERSRFRPDQQLILVEHYFAALEASRKCHEMLAVFGGKIPHQHGLTPAGIAVRPTADNKSQFLSLHAQVVEFIDRIMLPDFRLLAEVYNDYFLNGRGPFAYLSYGLFDPQYGGHFPGGLLTETGTIPVSLDEIAESIAYSWYEQEDSVAVPRPDKICAYSWVKAPRYRGLPCQGGPLARKLLMGGASGEIGTMGRLLARAEESDFIAHWMGKWVEALPERGVYILPLDAPVLPRAVQVNDAPRGPLLHAMTATGDEIDSYTVITPTTWNFSPKDETGRRGPAEDALVGTYLADPGDPVEAGRIIRSFDPCLNCATHVLDPQGLTLTRVNVIS